MLAPRGRVQAEVRARRRPAATGPGVDWDALTPEGLVRLVAQRFRAGATGVLEVSRAAGQARIYLRQGYPVGALDFGEFKPLGRYLLEQGHIDVAALDRSLAEVSRTGRPQGEVLVRLGYLTPERLALSLRRLQAHNLVTLLQEAEGWYRWHDTSRLPAWTQDLALSPHACVVQALSSPAATGPVARLLAPLGRRPVLLAPGWIQDRWRFELEESEREALEGLRRPATPGEALARTGIPARRLRALVAGLWVFGLLMEAPSVTSA